MPKRIWHSYPAHTPEHSGVFMIRRLTGPSLADTFPPDTELEEICEYNYGKDRWYTGHDSTVLAWRELSTPERDQYLPV